MFVNMCAVSGWEGGGGGRGRGRSRGGDIMAIFGYSDVVLSVRSPSRKAHGIELSISYNADNADIGSTRKVATLG